MHPKLAHLTTVQVQELIARYYNNERISDLIAEFKIDVYPSALVGLLPPIEHEECCLYCVGTPLVTKAESRSSGNWSKPVPSCPICRHVNSPNCRCKACCEVQENIIKFEQTWKRTVIQKTYDRTFTLPAIDDLTFKDVLFLISVIRHSANESFDYIEPFKNKSPSLTPSFDLTNFITKHLYTKGLISISPDSSIDSVAPIQV